MKSISIYDIEADKIAQLCEEHNTTEAELIETLINVIEDGIIDIEDWL